MSFFRVKNYERFQHYKDRSPPWIKLYNELLDDYAFGMLPDASKMHLVAIWLLASRSDNQIPLDPEWVSKRINATSKVNLDILMKAGFIESIEGCSNSIAERKQDACPEGEGETETEKKDISADSDFQAWYAAYPVHKGRGQAEKAYRSARKKTDAETLLAGAKRYAAEPNDPKFMAHPATWLNGERWADEPSKPGSKPPNGAAHGGGGLVRDSAAYDDMILKTRAEKLTRGERLAFLPAPEQIRRMVEMGWLSNDLAQSIIARNGASEN